jgi:hypothetical protein
VGGLVADLVDDTLRALDARIAELAPLVAEHSRLTQAATELRAVANAGARPVDRRRRPSRAKKGRQRRRGRTWKERFLAEVEKRPGATVSELAQHLRVHTRRLSTLGSQLTKSGEVKKKGRGFYPVSAAK